MRVIKSSHSLQLLSPFKGRNVLQEWNCCFWSMVMGTLEGCEKLDGLPGGHFRINFHRNAFASTQVRCTGKLPKRPKGSDCKSAVIDFVGSNPSLATKDPAMRGLFTLRTIVVGTTWTLETEIQK